MKNCKECEQPNADLVELSKCRHNICYECLCNHLDKLTCAKVVCPIKDCKRIIPDSIIRKCLSNDKLVVYDKLCFAPNTVKCLIKDCPYFVAYDDTDANFTCPICKQPNCLRCKKIHDVDTPCPPANRYNANKYENDAYQYLQKHRKEALINDSDIFDLIPNSDRFECPICFGLILPRNGVSLRNCMNTICKTCLNNTVSIVDNLKDLSCPVSECCRPLTERECIALIGREKLQKFCRDRIKPKMYACQTPECKGMWDFASYVGMHKCEMCGKFNCGTCQDIHEGKTCQEFQQTSRYIEVQKFRRRLDERRSITCQKCNVLIIQNSGCNALRCPTCRLQVCAYSGMEVGPRGCKCTNSKRCVVGCHPGCIPEGPTPYERQLAQYFWDN